MAKRLFIGLELPENTRELLARLDPDIRGVRWIAASQMHLTLSFLGQVEPEREARLIAALQPVSIAPFFLPIEGVGAFGGDFPSVIWAGVGKGHPHLFALHKRIQDAVFQAGFEPDLRAFHPHVTLARAKNVPRHAVRPFLLRYEHTDFDIVRVTGFTLFSSILSPDGSVYSTEFRREFDGGR
jgi:2'-5' RNA ligase